jgi:hypothetical protein
LHLSFNPAPSGEVCCLAVQADGKILVGGAFTNLAGQRRAYLGRLHDTVPATESLSFDDSSITWLRGGASPELWRTSFEASVDQADWVALGQGTRIAGGWQLTGLGLPPHACVRARGFVSGAGRSEWFVESLSTASAPIRLSLVRSGAEVVLSWTGGCGPYQVQQSTNLADPNGWTDLGAALTTNHLVLPIGSGHLFLRVREP